MEALKQWKPIQRFFVDVESILEGETDCPFCGSQLHADSESMNAYCVNDSCPFAESEDLQTVMAALIESGRDPLLAAQIAAKYSMPDSEPVTITPDWLKVESADKAEWVLRIMSEAQATVDEMQAHIDRELERISKRGNAILEPLRKRMEFLQAAFGEQLEEWTRGQLEGKSKKSIDLLYGRMGYRKSPDSLLVEDEAAAVDWAERHGYPECVRKSIAKTATKKLLTDVKLAEIDGARIVPGENKFYIQPDRGKPEGI